MLPFYLAGLKKIFSIGKKVFLVIAVYFIVISLFAHFINKDKPKPTYDPIKKNREEIYKVINDPKLNSTKQGKLQIAVYKFTMCGLVGEACTDNPQDANKNFNNSAFGFISKLIVTPFANPPASGVYWVYSGLQNANLIPKSYAAGGGIGFGSLYPLAKIWSAIRNVAYMLLVLIIITIGFMIMFRAKINPQTVVSIESALPKIVFALIVITFSFAIAGFLIDLMYFSIILIIDILGPAGNLTATDILQKKGAYLMAGPGELFGSLGGLNDWVTIMWHLPQALLSLIPIIGFFVRIVGVLLSAFLFYPWLAEHSPLGSNILKAFKDLSATSGIGVIWKGLGELISAPVDLVYFSIALFLTGTVLVPLFIGLLIAFTVIFIFFRILFMIFSAYIKILLLITISPIYLLLEALPGQSKLIGWLKNLVSQMIIFPLLVAIFMFAGIITSNATNGNIIQFPFLVGIDPKSLGLLLGMWFLFMTPDLIKLVQQVIEPKPLPLDAGLGVFFGGATTGISGGLGEISKYASLGYYIQPLRPLIKTLTLGAVDIEKAHSGGQGIPPHPQ